MTAARFSMSFVPDEDGGSGALHVTASSGAFAGYGMDVVATDDLRRFGPALRRFPLEEAATIVGLEGDVVVTAEAVDAWGRLRLVLDLRDRECRVRLTMSSDYPTLAQLAGQVERMAGTAVDVEYTWTAE
jgi:hypothetical protein